MIRAILLGLSLLGLTGADDESNEQKALAGTWLLESATLAGRDHTEDFAGMKLILKVDKYTVEFGKNTDKGTFTLNTAKSPRQISIKSAEGPFKGKTLPGIYELKGDRLRLCVEADGKAELRPLKFEAPDSTRNMLLDFRRAK